jgi:hypothetical protein
MVPTDIRYDGVMSELGPKGDIPAAFGHVRSIPETGRRVSMSRRA